MPKPIYLDHAAATPIDSRVLQVMAPYQKHNFYNPSANYRAARSVKKNLETARASVAEVLGVRPSEVIFTAGGTEANNLAIAGVLNQFPEGNVITSAIEHESVLRPAERFSHKLAAVDSKGLLDVPGLLSLIDQNTVLISVIYANNEVGTIQPIRELGQAIKNVRQERLAHNNTTPLYFHTDACQAAELLDLHLSRLAVDMMSINGGKIYGPKQSGALVISSSVKLQPLIVGGGQEHNLRSGTESLTGSIGFAWALSLAQSNRVQETERQSNLQQYFLEQLSRLIPEATVNGSLKKRLASNVHITIPGANNERLLIQLDQAGIMVAAGSACAADSGEASHVLLAMGISETASRSSLRFSFGRSTTRRDLLSALKILAGMV